MKLLKCIIRPERLDDVKEALSAVSVSGMTLSEVRGMECYRSSATKGGIGSAGSFTPHIEIEVVVPDNKARPVMDVMLAAARSGNAGDGKLFIMNVDQAVRIRTGECDDGAL